MYDPYTSPGLEKNTRINIINSDVLDIYYERTGKNKKGDYEGVLHVVTPDKHNKYTEFNDIVNQLNAALSFKINPDAGR